MLNLNYGLSSIFANLHWQLLHLISSNFKQVLTTFCVTITKLPLLLPADCSAYIYSCFLSSLIALHDTSLQAHTLIYALNFENGSINDYNTGGGVQKEI